MTNKYFFIFIFLIINSVHAEILDIGGSSTLYPAISAISNLFMKTYPEIKIVNTAGSSSKGIKLFLDSSLEIAGVSRELHLDEIDMAIKNNKKIQMINIGIDAVVIIVNPYIARFLTNISFKELEKIFYSNTITSWKDLSHDLTGKIQVYVRQEDEGSGTVELFNEKVKGFKKINFIKNAIRLSSSEEILSAIAKDKNGIAFISIAQVIDDNIYPLAIKLDDNKTIINSDLDNIRSQKYPLSRKVYLVADIKSSFWVAKFIDFVVGEKGQSLIKINGLVPIR